MPVVSLLFPVRGLHRGLPATRQRDALLSTPDAFNVREQDTVENRLRGGSRPGLTRLRSEPFQIDESAPGPIHLLSSVNVVPTSDPNLAPVLYVDGLTDDFFDEGWTVPNNLFYHEPPFGVRPITAGAAVAYRPMPEIQRQRGYQVEVRYIGERSTLVALGVVGVILECSADGLDYHAAVLNISPWTPLNYRVEFQHLVVEGGSIRLTEGLMPPLILGGEVLTGNFSVRAAVDQTGTVTTSFNNGRVLRTGGFVMTERRSAWGFRAMVDPRTPLDKPHVRQFRAEYRIERRLFQVPRSVRVVGVARRVGAEQWLDFWSDATGDWRMANIIIGGGTLPNAYDSLMAVDHANGSDHLNQAIRRGMLYIADFVPASEGAVQPAPLVFDPAGNTVRDWSTDNWGLDPEIPEDRRGQPKGQVPRGCPILARFRGRMILAGNPAHAWFASRIGDPHDFDFSPLLFEDPARAIAGISSEQGDLSEPISAVAQLSDEYLIVSTRNALWRFSGDPGYGGQPLRISGVVGILDRFCWCTTPESEMVLLTDDGIFLLGPGAISNPQPLSRDTLPMELRRIDTGRFEVFLVYDLRDVGVHIIFRDKVSGLSTQNWWFSRRTMALLPGKVMSPPISYAADFRDARGASVVGLGGSDAVLRTFDRLSADDDGAPFESHVLLGPLMMGAGDHEEGIAHWMRVSPAAGSRVGFRFMGFDSADAFNRGESPKSSITGEVGGTGWDNNKRVPIRVRGVVGYLKLFGVNGAWSFDSLDLNVEPVAESKPSG